jgi:DNA-binding GntR family transcriptional regulator
MTVPRLVPQRVSEVLAIRSCLECFALKLAIPRITEAQVALLRSIFMEMEDARLRSDVDVFEDRDEALHRAILDAAGSEVLIAVIDDLSKQIRTMRGALLTLPGELALSQEFHRELIEAIAQRDVARAVKLREGALEVDEQKLLLQLRDSLRKSGRSTS